MKFKFILAVVLISAFSFAGITYYDRVLPKQQATTTSIELPAFKGVKSKTEWKLTLEPGHFIDQVKAVAVTYNDTFYGVFLLSDDIYLPIFMPNAALVISPLNEEGNPISNAEEVYIVGDSDVHKTP
jgi:hypothetical protein